MVTTSLGGPEIQLEFISPRCASGQRSKVTWRGRKGPVEVTQEIEGTRMDHRYTSLRDSVRHDVVL